MVNSAAATATATAAAPPRIPIPSKDSKPALLPTPPANRRLAPPPASAAPPASKKPGRATASQSWIRDKAAGAGLAPPTPIERRDASKIPGRASCSDSWVRDKLLAAAATPPPPTGAWNGGCGKRIIAPSADRVAKLGVPRCADWRCRNCAEDVFHSNLLLEKPPT